VEQAVEQVPDLRKLQAVIAAHAPPAAVVIAAATAAIVVPAKVAPVAKAQEVEATVAKAAGPASAEADVLSMGL
jgi:hypothetical protein